MKLMNKVAAITGAGRGIGRAAAERFAREGARGVILEKDAALGREVEDAIGTVHGPVQTQFGFHLMNRSS